MPAALARQRARSARIHGVLDLELAELLQHDLWAEKATAPILGGFYYGFESFQGVRSVFKGLERPKLVEG